MRLDMAKSREINLKQRVLAKLMLLEYFRPESFKALAEIQANQSGKAKELAAAEQSGQVEPTNAEGVAKPKGKVQTKKPQPAKSELPTWLIDDWAKEWIATRPAAWTRGSTTVFLFLS